MPFGRVAACRFCGSTQNIGLVAADNWICRDRRTCWLRQRGARLRPDGPQPSGSPSSEGAPSLDVVVPATRQRETQAFVDSLSLGTMMPRRVVIVSNEIRPFYTRGLEVVIVRFWSKAYCYGDHDVALRQNVGIFWTDSERVVLSGDDQLASRTMIEDSHTVLDEVPYVWGNHRKLSFGRRPVRSIVDSPSTAGASREIPEPPFWHGWQSCYGGMFAFRREHVTAHGGFDMAYNCRHAGEDQQLGRRLAAESGEQRVWIVDRPFSWMNTDPRTSYGILRTNSCHDHRFVDVDDHGYRARRCTRCPYEEATDDAIYDPVLHWRYDPDLVTTEVARVR